MNRFFNFSLLTVFTVCLLTFGKAELNAAGPESLFGLTNVIDVQLNISAEEWAKMQPPPGTKMDGVSVMLAFEDLIKDAVAGKHMWSEKSTRPGLAGYLGVDHQYGMGDVTIDGDSIEGVGLRYKGNGTFLEGFAIKKFSFKIDFNEYQDDLEFRGLRKINLNNCITDPSMLREALSYELFREAGIPCSRVGFARVRATVPGEFDDKSFGLYTVIEQVDKRFLKDRYGSSKGLLLKPSTFGVFRYMGEDWADYERPYVPKTDPTEEQQRRVIEFAKLLNEADDAAFEQEVEEYLDVDQFVRFVAVNALLSNLDSFLGGTQNHYIYLEPESNKFQFLPWDMDHSFGAFPLEGSADNRRKLSIDRPGGSRNLLITRVLNIPRHKELYNDYIAEYLDSIFAEEKVRQQIDDAAEFVRPLIDLNGDTAKTRFERVVAEGAPQPGEQHPMKFFVSERRKSVQGQLDGETEGYVPFTAEMKVPPIRKLIGFGIALMVLLLLNFAGWIWGVVAGFRGTAGWGVLNIFFYPLTPIIYGFVVRKDLGRRAALWALVWATSVAVLFIAAAVSLNS